MLLMRCRLMNTVIAMITASVTRKMMVESVMISMVLLYFASASCSARSPVSSSESASVSETSLSVEL